MLIRQACVVRPDLPNDPMTLDAVRAFRLVLGQAASWYSAVRGNAAEQCEKKCRLTVGDNCGYT